MLWILLVLGGAVVIPIPILCVGIALWERHQERQQGLKEAREYGRLTHAAQQRGWKLEDAGDVYGWRWVRKSDGVAVLWQRRRGLAWVTAQGEFPNQNEALRAALAVYP